MSVYADTSFFVSLYLRDRHSTTADQRLVSRPVLWMTPLHVAEWTHAVEHHVFRKAISRNDADLIRLRFTQHRAQGLWKETALPEKAFDSCIQLAQVHAARLGVRTLDTLHVASALELKAQQFWTFDQRQARLAVAVGLQVT